jgi:hypothetical protein
MPETTDSSAMTTPTPAHAFPRLPITASAALLATSGHGQPSPDGPLENPGPGRVGLACQAEFGPDFLARTPGRARLAKT